MKKAISILCAGLVISALFTTESTGRMSGKPRSASDINIIVIHSVDGPFCKSGAVVFSSAPDDADHWKTRMLSSPNTDAHFVIGRTGKVVEVIPVLQVAHHTLSLNKQSIGIELVNHGDGLDLFPEPQIDALVELVNTLKEKFPLIRKANIIRHSDFDQRTCLCAGQPYRRRQDPGAAFPFDRVLGAITADAPDQAELRALPSPLVGPAPDSDCVTVE